MGAIRQTKVNREFTSRLATVAAVTYVGFAVVGSLGSDNVWQVKKINETTGVVITWADGNSEFDNVWDNYLSLTYS